MSRPYFAVGSNITWKQYTCKTSTVAVVRSGMVWADAPAFEGGGAHVWVIPTDRYPGEQSAIAVRVHRGGRRKGDAEIYEDAPSYSAYSLKGVTKL